MFGVCPPDMTLLCQQSRIACKSIQLLSVIQILEIYSQEMRKTAGFCNSPHFFLRLEMLPKLVLPQCRYWKDAF